MSTIEFPETKKTKRAKKSITPQGLPEFKEEVNLWKGKYIALLEDYNKLLKK